jgi:ribonuclease-3
MIWNRNSNYLETYLKKNKLFDTDEIKHALTHKSVNAENYEKLEFLGDSILNLVISEYLFKNKPDYDVGELAKIKSYLVSKEVLFKIGGKNSIIKYLKFSRALNKKEVRNNKKIISDAVESLLGALYLTKGFEVTKEIILKVYEKDLKAAKEKGYTGDFKSDLQMKALGVFGELPVYAVVKTEGEEHKKIFYVEVSIKGKVIGKGKGKSIKDAEKIAAGEAIEDTIFKGGTVK